MSPLPEQFSEARKLQIEAQLKILSTFTGKAFESAEKLIALNIDTSRASLEKSSALVRQMIAIKDPRDLFALTSQTQSQFDSVLAYGRELFGIATGVMAAPVEALAAPVAPAAPAAAPAPAVNQWTAAPESVTPAAASAPAAAAPAEVLVAQEPAPQPAAAVQASLIAEPTPVAKALGVPEALHPSAASFPVPSSSTPIEVGQVKPVEAAPPHAPVSGTPPLVAKKADAPGAKASRKK